MKGDIQDRTHIKRGTLGQDWPASYLKTIACPVCSFAGRKGIYQHFYHRLVACLKCGLIYINPRLKSKYLKHLYTRSYFQNTNSSHFGYENYIADEEKIIKTFSKRLKDIEKFTKKGRLLDVGCATGFFLKAAQNYKWEVEGTEISAFAIKYAREKLGFKIYEKAPSLIKSLKKYDLITLWDVIEHFDNPQKELRAIRTLLKKDGLLVISTPDVSSIPARLSKHRWVGYKLSDEHLTYFSQKTITELLEKTGFEVERVSYIGKYVSLMILSDRISLYSKFLGRLVKFIENVFPKTFSVYVNPFDIMCVYAKIKED